MGDTNFLEFEDDSSGIPVVFEAESGVLCNRGVSGLFDLSCLVLGAPAFDNLFLAGDVCVPVAGGGGVPPLAAAFCGCAVRLLA